MSPIKLSLIPSNDDDRTEIVELDDELIGKLRATVDADPDLTLAEALRRGIQHVVDNPPTRKGPSAG